MIRILHHPVIEHSNGKFIELNMGCSIAIIVISAGFGNRLLAIANGGFPCIYHGR